MDEDQRERFLMTWLLGYADLFDLLPDFRFGGYRVLNNLICDINDENTSRDRKRLIRDGDSPAFVSLMEAYQNKPNTQNYREAVCAKCRMLLDEIVKPVIAVRYVVALGKRDLLWDLLPDAVPPMCWRCAMVNEWSEFLQYTSPVTYAASGKRDVRFLGRFTWDTLLDFEGLARVLTILARGHLFHRPDGSLTDDP